MPSDKLLRTLLVTLAGAALLYLGRHLFIPLSYGLLVALVLHPFVAGMEHRGVPRGLAIALGLAAVAAVFGSLLGLLLWQFDAFLHAAPSVAAGAAGRFNGLLHGILDRLHPDGGSGSDSWTALLRYGPMRLAPYASAALSALLGMLFNLFIIPIFTALLLYQRRTYAEALAALVPVEWAGRIPALLHRATAIYARFIGGMVQVYVIVGLLNTAGFLALGVPNPLLFGMLTAIATIVPYVGIVASSLLPISLAWSATGDIWMPLGIVAVLAVVQYLEANLIFPRVVGGRLGLSTMASLVIIFAGGLLWGLAGMVLFLPFISILALLAKEIPEWRALRLLLSGSAD
jgi:predicted PurR-regulated permease PerM